MLFRTKETLRKCKLMDKSYQYAIDDKLARLNSIYRVVAVHFTFTYACQRRHVGNVKWTQEEQIVTAAVKIHLQIISLIFGK